MGGIFWDIFGGLLGGKILDGFSCSVGGFLGGFFTGFLEDFFVIGFFFVGFFLGRICSLKYSRSLECPKRAFRLRLGYVYLIFIRIF